jgi:hypothetical protein
MTMMAIMIFGQDMLFNRLWIEERSGWRSDRATKTGEWQKMYSIDRRKSWEAVSPLVSQQHRAFYRPKVFMFCWPCIIVYQCNETNVMPFLFSLLRIKGLYMIRALLAHPQEEPRKQYLVDCVRVISVGCTRIWSVATNWNNTHSMYQALFV